MDSVALALLLFLVLVVLWGSRNVGMERVRLVALFLSATSLILPP